jgi:hypothetical protein
MRTCVTADRLLLLFICCVDVCVQLGVRSPLVRTAMAFESVCQQGKVKVRPVLGVRSGGAQVAVVNALLLKYIAITISVLILVLFTLP